LSAALLLLILVAKPSLLRVPVSAQTPVKAAVRVQAVLELVDLKVDGVTYSFQLTSRDPAHVNSVAHAFCQQLQPQTMPSEELRGCTELVRDSLLVQVEKKKEEREEKDRADEKDKASAVVLAAPHSTPTPPTVYQVIVPMTSGATYAITFDASRHNAYDVAAYFCRQNAQALGLADEHQLLYGCIPPVGRFIALELSKIGFVGSADEIQQPAQAAYVEGVTVTVTLAEPTANTVPDDAAADDALEGETGAGDAGADQELR